MEKIEWSAYIENKKGGFNYIADRKISTPTHGAQLGLGHTLIDVGCNPNTINEHVSNPPFTPTYNKY